MNKTYKISALWMMCLLFISCLLFTACNNGDEEDTDQYNKGVKLNVFGPCPVARGGELRFLGSGMNQVTGVVIPGCDEITDITVISDTEIRITVPQTATTGLVILHTSNGDITTKTGITFTEPISIDKVTPLAVKAGDELTITGEYLNLIKEVIFAENVVVTEFVSRSRKEIKVIVPEAAQSGKVIISDGAEMPNWIYSDAELDVTLPSVEKTQDLTKAKPGDNITITGKNLDLVKSIEMPGGESVAFKQEENKLTFQLPTNASDGVIVMIPASGVRVAIANIGMAVPAELVATPAKDIRAKEVITVKGVNMELITNVTFPGVEAPVKLDTQTSTEIKVTMPDAAISGDLVLNTASGNKVPIAISTLKPQVLSYAVSMVPAGDKAVLHGKDLDLVVSVTFVGDKKVEATSTQSTELIVVVPVDAESGELTLTMANGETVKAPSLQISKPEFCYIPELPGEDVEIHAGQVMMVKVENNAKLQTVQVEGKTVQHILAGSTLYVSIPNNVSGNTTVTLKSSNGEITYVVSVIGSGIKETVVFEGAVMLSWSDGGRVMVPASGFDNVGAGSILKIYFTQTDNWGQIQINQGKWGTLNFAELSGGVLNTDNLGDKSLTSKELVLTNDVLKAIRDNFDNGNGIIMQGSDFIVSKVSIITKAAAEVTVFEGPLATGSWANSAQIEAVEFADAKVGNVITIKTSNLEAGAQGSLKTMASGWPAITANTEYFDITGDFQLTITADILAKLKAEGLIVSGQKYTIVSVTFK